MSITSTSISATLNEKHRGKKLNITNQNKNLISNALSFIWLITNKKIERCTFLMNNTGNAVKIDYKKGEGSLFFDLHNNEKLLSNFAVRIGHFFSNLGLSLCKV